MQLSLHDIGVKQLPDKIVVFAFEMRYNTLTTFDGCFYSVRLLSNDKIQNCFVVSRLYGMSSYVNGRDIPIYKRKYFFK